MAILTLQAPVERLMMRHVFRAFAMVAMAVIASDGMAQDWPSRSVSIVNLFGGGGSGDFASRVSAKALSDRFGQPFVVENRPGAGGSVGYRLCRAVEARRLHTADDGDRRRRS